MSWWFPHGFDKDGQLSYTKYRTPGKPPRQERKTMQNLTLTPHYRFTLSRDAFDAAAYLEQNADPSNEDFEESVILTHASRALQAKQGADEILAKASQLLEAVQEG